jgi:RimJ/RimL family protein N-acetyltransferase
LQQGKAYNDIYVHADEPAGVARFTYVIFSPTVQNEVVARCTVIFDSVRQGVATWQADWAVVKKYRGKNWGKAVATKALTEFCNGMQGKLPGGFAIEAVVDEGNEASIKISEALIGNEEVIFNNDTGKNVHTFLRHFDL